MMKNHEKITFKKTNEAGQKIKIDFPVKKDNFTYLKFTEVKKRTHK